MIGINPGPLLMPPTVGTSVRNPHGTGLIAGGRIL